MLCPRCGYEFDAERLGIYGCPNCEGEGMSAHTPGPWRANAPKGGLGKDWDAQIMAPQTAPRAIYVASVTQSGLRDEATVAANLRVIAAAPELLAALEAIVRAEWTTVSLQGMTAQHRARLEAARAAIAKATSE